jgi:hypothetical protein
MQTVIRKNIMDIIEIKEKETAGLMVKARETKERRPPRVKLQIQKAGKRIQKTE